MKTIKLFKKVDGGIVISLSNFCFFIFGIINAILFWIAVCFDFNLEFLNKVGTCIKILPLLIIFVYPFIHAGLFNISKTPSATLDVIGYLLGGAVGTAIDFVLVSLFAVGLLLFHVIKFLYEGGFLFPDYFLL
jgi:hypothetical protein